MVAMGAVDAVEIVHSEGAKGMQSIAMKQEHLPKIIELRHKLHQHPELSMQEAHTIKTLIEFLKENTTLEIVEREGWFYAVKQGVAGCGSIAFHFII